MKKLCELLTERREHLGLSIDQIAHETKIRKEFIVAMEEGRYNDLPSDSYAMGFVKTYALFLGLPEGKAMALFRRDYKTGKLDVVPSFRKKKYTRSKTFMFSIKGGAFLGVVLIILAYLGFQFSSLFLGPKLAVSSPRNGVTLSKNIVEIKGETDPYATLLINGEETYVGLDGAFRKTLYVFSGKQTITITAKNRFGKATVEKIGVTIKQ